MRKRPLLFLLVSFVFSGCTDILFPMTPGKVSAAGYQEAPRRRFIFSRQASAMAQPENTLFVDFDFVKSIKEYRVNNFTMPADITHWQEGSATARSGFAAMKERSYHNLYIAYTSMDTFKVHFTHSNLVKEEEKGYQYDHASRTDRYVTTETKTHDLSTQGTFTFWFTKDSVVDYSIQTGR